jgi:predicted chitinase
VRIERGLLTGLGVTSARADRYLKDLDGALTARGIDTPLRVAHFLAQILHESGKLRTAEENLNYSAEGLRSVFRKYFADTEAEAFARKPELIANRVYAGRMGNGNETSGDGYRYRGRGLIQLTGKSNYSEFAKWVGDDDVVGNPATVASKYAVHSAVYFWDSRNLNALADADDVRAVTKKINGGFNGLEDRIGLLDRAKALLAIDGTTPPLDEPTHVVTASLLNLRSRPVVKPSTRVVSLAEGTAVRWIRAGEVEGWGVVRARVNGQVVEGYVSVAHLGKLTAKDKEKAVETETLPERAIPEVHLSRNNPTVTRRRDGGRAHPLGEPGCPGRTGRTPETRRRQLIEIVRYLDCESDAHLRYLPRSRTTFCNVYAYDYCYLAGAYLPRVWWTGTALARIASSEDVPVRYGDTVRELNANMLHDWLAEDGRLFGWKSVTTLDELQAAANRGEVGLIVGERANPNDPGHVAAVVPEHEDRSALRAASGLVTRPLTSEAGRKNHCFAAGSAWWTGARFQSFAFWRHE